MRGAQTTGKALGYVRVSTDLQVTRGHSLLDQRRRLKEYVGWKLGIDLPEDHIYSDPGVSGTWTVSQVPLPGAGVRPALSELVDRCMEGDVEALVIDTIDRLARDPYVCFGIQRQLEPHGVRVLIADGDLDFTDPDGELAATFQMGVSRAEVKKMSKRALRAQAERRAAGYPPWGKMGYGWRWQTEQEFRSSSQPFKGIVRVDDEAELVEWIFEQYLRRGRVILDICARLNSDGVAYRGSEAQWQAYRVRMVLDNPHHAGLVKDNDDQLIRGAHFEQRIIDPDIWHAVQDLRSDRATRGPRALSLRDAPLLSVARCGHCGQRLQLQRDRDRKTYYVCPKPQEGETRDCGGLVKQTDAVETVVATMVGEIAAAPRLREMIRHEASQQLGTQRDELEARRAALEEHIREVEDQLTECAALLTAGDIKPESFARVEGRWLEQLSAAEEELEEVERRLEHGDVESQRLDQVMAALDNFADTWQRLGAESVRQLLLTMVEDLTIEPHEDSSVTVHFKCYYMPEMTQHIPHLRGAVGGDDERLRSLTPTDLAFLALWAEDKSVQEIDDARGLKPGSSYSRVHLIRQRTGLRDLDVIADMARPLIEQYRELLPTDRPAAQVAERLLAPTEAQLRVARLYADGMDYEQIAQHLDIRAVSTVRRHMCDLRARLGAGTSEGALAELAAQGLLQAAARPTVE